MKRGEIWTVAGSATACVYSLRELPPERHEVNQIAQ